MKIAVRLDDITPDMDWECFFKFKALLDHYQVKPLIGVVPDNQDENLKGTQNGAPEEFWAYIKELQENGWTVAMHGYRHIYATDKAGVFPLNCFSEFAGISYEEQKEMLTEGKQVLAQNGIETDIFMAPAHSYDNNTLKALKATGFKKVTDGFGSRPYTWKGLDFYPISFKMSRTLRKKRGYSTLVVHTGTIHAHEWEVYDNYFKNPDAVWIDYCDYMKEKPVNRTHIGRIIEYCMAAIKAVLVKIA
ncbi:MAG: DUF2334 domain-containing protein [Lachnospiraceae bacterium]|nr:DUF2334 domain-containing protein [Lachnospiraceae bacterium]